MVERVCKSREELLTWCRYLAGINAEFPLVVTWREGDDRSKAQNRLAFKWYKQIADQMGDREAWQVRAHCKLEHGVRMLVTENEDFRTKWHDMIMDRFTYEEKLKLMVEPWDFPVSRIMGVKQMTRYLDAIYNEFTALGVRLTLPEVL